MKNCASCAQDASKDGHYRFQQSVRKLITLRPRQNSRGGDDGKSGKTCSTRVVSNADAVIRKENPRIIALSGMLLKICIDHDKHNNPTTFHFIPRVTVAMKRFLISGILNAPSFVLDGRISKLNVGSTLDQHVAAVCFTIALLRLLRFRVFAPNTCYSADMCNHLDVVPYRKIGTAFHHSFVASCLSVSSHCSCLVLVTTRGPCAT